MQAGSEIKASKDQAMLTGLHPIAITPSVEKKNQIHEQVSIKYEKQAKRTEVVVAAADGLGSARRASSNGDGADGAAVHAQLAGNV
jgi:hypothetical protein